MTDVHEGTSDSAELAVTQAAQGGIRAQRPLADAVERAKEGLAKALPPGVMDVERFIRIILTEFRKTPKLLTCTPDSFLGALFQIAQLGLEPGGQLGHAFLIPYDTTRRGESVTECQLQIGYKGYIELAGRRGIVIRAREVRELDDFDFELGSNERLHHSYRLNPDVPRTQQNVIGYYGKVTMPDGTTTFHVMDTSEINARKNRSSAVRSGKRTPWDTDPEAMARKTVVRAMVPQIALAPELQVALRADEAVIERKAEGDLSYLYRDAIDVSTPADDLNVDQTTGEIDPSDGQDDAPDDADAPPVDDAAPEPTEPEGDAEDAILASTKAAVDSWPIETVRNLLGAWEENSKGNAAEARLRLTTRLALERKKGNKAADDLF